MDERIGIVTMRGNPLTLVGYQVKVGDAAPDFVVIDNNLPPHPDFHPTGAKPASFLPYPLSTLRCVILRRGNLMGKPAVGDSDLHVNDQHGPAICTETMVWRGRCG